MPKVFHITLSDPDPGDGSIIVTCPELPELNTQGNTVEEALDAAGDALQAVMEGYAQLGRKVG